MTDEHGSATAHNEWFFARGGLGRDGWESVVDARIPGWRHAGLRVADLGAADLTLPADATERLVVPLSGAFRVRHEGTATVLDGRASVFDGPSDVLYLGTGTAASIGGRGRVAVAEAPATARFPSRHIRRDEIPVEIRGAGRDTRQVHNFGTPQTLDAGSFIVCEVITPAGNWSSHPAHKHDQHVPGRESRLAEIYYFEAAPARGLNAGPGGAPDAFGMFASYSSPAGPIDTNAIVRTGDIALVPHGYHGPAAAAPEYDLYYLNVMAGPGPERAWHVTDDPAQAWIRASWDGEPADPRLPYRRGGPRLRDDEEAPG
jgi:5-deoxy-glucuronate isomerase